MHFPIAKYLGVYFLGFFVLIAIIGVANIPTLLSEKPSITGAAVVDEIPTPPAQPPETPANATSPPTISPQDR